MTERLYYTDAYLTSFEARVAGSDNAGTRVYLDRTAFYPTSGGQVHDTGTLNGINVVEVIDEDDRVVHVLSAPLLQTQSVTGSIDWSRRFDHMQQHTGQHLLSAVLHELFDAPTVSFHMSADACTIDLAVPALSPEQLWQTEDRVNALIAETRPVHVSFEDAADVHGLRKASERTGTLRVITIDGLDRSACGGTHVRSTGEIGCVLLRGTEKIRGNVRLEFVCGLRAVRRSRSEFNALQATARSLTAALDEVPARVTAQIEKLNEAGKLAKKQGAELAAYRGRDLYRQTEPAASGLRLHARRVEALSDEHRAEAQAFTAESPAAFICWSADPPAILLAVSEAGGMHAGNLLKPLLAEAAGRGGGSQRIAQGSVGSAGAAESIMQRLASALAIR